MSLGDRGQAFGKDINSLHVGPVLLNAGMDNLTVLKHTPTSCTNLLLKLVSMTLGTFTASIALQYGSQQTMLLIILLYPTPLHWLPKQGARLNGAFPTLTLKGR